MKILIAENNSGFQSLYERIMNRKGYEYDFACDYSETIKLINSKKKKYDLCLYGFDMPFIDVVLEPVTKIRNKTKYIPIMAITGINQIKDSISYFDDFLKKPFQINELYNKIKKLTVKKIKITANTNKEIDLEKEMPMNKEELQELIELKKKGLTKLKLVGTETTFIVHKNIQNKISHDIIGEGKELSEFIDRSENEPGRCHLYKVNLHVTKDIFTPQELKDAIQVENEIAEKFNQAVDKKIED